MNWYSLYVDGDERATDVTLHASQTKASSFMDDNRSLRITYGTPSHTIRAWCYDHDAHAWLTEQAA